MMKKKIFTLSIALLMSCGIQETVVATANDNEEIKPLSVYWDEELHIDSVEKSGIGLQQESLESSYVSPYVTPVKNQDIYGSCWAFSHIAAAESSMIQEGIAEKEELDLSEWHLAYFLSHSVADPLGGTKGDSFSFIDNDYLNIGGNQELATYRTANWYGLADEETAPYTTVVDSKGKEKLSDDIAYSKDVAHLENAYWVSLQDKDTVKQMIKQYGAGGTAYYSADAYYSTGKEMARKTEKEVAVYCPEEQLANHGVTIVGWDDNYSKDNFGTYKPKADGAWYCKNSWGTDWSKDGYMWISYEDKSLLDGEAFFYDYASADNYDHNYQYDGGAWGGHSYTCRYEANVYTAQQPEQLKAVGFYTRNSDYNCIVRVYKHLKTEEPDSGELVVEQTANQTYAGFHTVELEKPVTLNEGDTFSVVIYQETSQGEPVSMVVDSAYDDGVVKNVSSAKAGQSFVSAANLNWKDISGEDGSNCRIKAYTDDRVPVTSVKLDQNNIELNKDDSETICLKADVIPADATDTSVTWKSDDETVAEVDANGNVTILNAGEVTISCISNDDSSIKDECKLVVKQWVTDIVLDYVGDEITTGEVMEIKPIISPKNATDQNVKWESSDEEVATISADGKVKGLKYGTTTITCTATDRNECIATCKIYVYEKTTGISFEQEKVVMNTGEELQLKPVITPDVDTTKGVYWISSDEKIVKVDEKGHLTAIAPGEDVEISCIAKDGTGIKTICKVDVHKLVTDLELQTKQLELIQGETAQLEAKTKPADATNSAVTWESSNPEVATVDDKGMVTTVGIGNAVITCKTADESDLSTVCNVVVKEKVVTYPEGKEIQDPVTSMKYVVTKGGQEGATVQFADGSSCKGTVTIPATIKAEGVVYQVTSIAPKAFNKNQEITQVVIDADIPTIEADTFFECNNLVSVIFGKDVQSVGTNAFFSCNSLKTIVLGTNTKVIGAGAFYDCGNLTSITCGDNIQTIGENAFYGCISLSAITLGDDTQSIGANAFYGCRSLTSVTFGNQMQTIGSNAFYGCNSLTSVTLGANTKAIGSKAFYGCTNLTSVIFGANTESVGANAFEGCNNLKTVTTGSKLTTIGKGAFYKCKNLTRITLPATVKKIGKQAFYKCKSLNKIVIQTKILTNKSVGYNAFKGISTQAKIKVPKKKLAEYKKMLKKKGIGKRVTVKK